MKKRKIIYIILEIVIVIVAFGVGYYIKSYVPPVNHAVKSNAETNLNMHVICVDGMDTEDYYTISIRSKKNTILNEDNSSVRRSFLVEQPATGHIDVSFYEDKELKKEWTENSSDYFTIDYSFKNEKSKKNIVEVTLIPKISKTNDTGVNIEEDIYVKINGKTYGEEYKED